MTPRDRPFAGGFLLTRGPLTDVAHYRPLALPGGWNLWHDDLVSTSHAETPSGDFVLIRGHWADVHDDVNQDQPVAERLLHRLLTSDEAFFAYLDQLGGRFVIITRQASRVRVFHDPLGLRTVYYPADAAMACSHVNLLADHGDYPTICSSKTAFPNLDATTRRGIRQLLPNHALNVAESTAQRYFPRNANPFTDWSFDERYERIIELWQRQMSLYAQSHPRTAISITGGMDSRLMLAMASEQSPHYTGFTYGLLEASDADDWHRKMARDYTLALPIVEASKLGEHRFIDLNNRVPDTPQWQDLLTKNTVGSHAHHLVRSYREAFPESDWLHVRGNGVEIASGRQWNWREKPRITYQDFLQELRRLGVETPEVRAKQLGYDRPMHGYSRMDLGYWEIRIGKWHAEIMNEHDAAFDSVAPVGIRAILQILMTFPRSERRTGAPLRELVNRTMPVFNFFGVNDFKNLYEQQRDERRPAGIPNTLRDVTLHHGGEKTPLTARAEALSVPQEHLLPGRSVSAAVYTTSKAGTVQFRVHQPYENSRATEHFFWEVRVDDVPVVRCDGAATAIPTQVRVSGLKAGQTVRLHVVSRRRLQTMSWQKASTTSIHALRFSAKGGGLPLQAHTDAPEAICLTTAPQE